MHKIANGQGVNITKDWISTWYIHAQFKDIMAESKAKTKQLIKFQIINVLRYISNERKIFRLWTNALVIEKEIEIEGVSRTHW